MSILRSFRSLLSRAAAAMPAATPSLTVDDAGVRRQLADGRVESVAWSDLESVEILTTCDGPFAEDVFFLLFAADGKGCAVPHGAAMETDLLARLQALPGFDNMAAIAAMGSAVERRFPCWRRMRS